MCDQQKSKTQSAFVFQINNFKRILVTLSKSWCHINNMLLFAPIMQDAAHRVPWTMM